MSKLLALTLAALLGVSLTACETGPNLDGAYANMQRMNLAQAEHLRHALNNPNLPPEDRAKLEQMLDNVFASGHRLAAEYRVQRAEEDRDAAVAWGFIQQQNQRNWHQQQYQQQQYFWMQQQQQQNWARQQPGLYPPTPAPLYYPPPIYIP